MEENKNRERLEQQILSRRENIIDAAINEFLTNGIDNSKISDIAKRASVGEATVYRYFENKPRLVIDSATKLWSRELESYLSQMNTDAYIRANGFEQVKAIFEIIVSLYEASPELLRLLEQLDNYIVRERISKETLRQYESEIDSFRRLLLAAINTGQKDGSIRSDIDGVLFFETASHSIITLSQKLLIRGDIIKSDKDTDAKAQLELLAEMELDYIKRR